MAKFCTACGHELSGSPRFCTECGAPAAPPVAAVTTAAESVPAPALSPPADEGPFVPDAPPPPPPPPSTRPPWLRDASPRDDASVPAPAAPVPPPDARPASTAPTASTQAPAPEVPAAASPLATRVLEHLRGAGVDTEKGWGLLLARMVRASVLDRSLYSEVLARPGLSDEAWRVLGLVVVLSSIGTLYYLLSWSGLFSVLAGALTQLVAFAAWVGAVQLGSSIWLERRLSFGEVFRVLAYAQAPGVLQLLPVIGQAVGLWRLVTSTVAVQVILRCTLVQALILALVGFAGAMLATYLVGPVIGAVL